MTADKPPIKKLVLLMAVSGQIVRIVSVIAPIKLDTAAPDNTMVSLDAPFSLLKNTLKRWLKGPQEKLL
ncbi:MAG: hypothetical protein ACOX2A_08395 [Tepidanaerobacteraceae bacterium]